VPPPHLMRPVHSAGRQRPVHSAGGVPVHSVGRRYAHITTCATLVITRTSPRKQPPGYQYCVDCGHHGARRFLRRTRISYFYNVFPPFCCWAHMSGLSILVRAPFELLKGGHTTLQGRLTQTSDSQVHTSSQVHRLNTTHSGVGYYAPAA
jgi:hypothetical protein